MSFTKKTSLTYKQSIFSRKNFGAPGYKFGNTLLVGNGVSTANGTYVNASEQGFQLRGADNHGSCYNMMTAVTNGINATSYLISNYTTTPYFDDPTLTMQSSMLYGCRM